MDVVVGVDARGAKEGHVKLAGDMEALAVWDVLWVDLCVLEGRAIDLWACVDVDVDVTLEAYL